MYYNVENKDSYRIVKAHYQSLEDQLRHIETAPTNERVFSGRLSSMDDGSRFSQSDSLEEAIEICRYGYRENLQTFLSLKREIVAQLPTVVNLLGTVPSVYGDYVNIPAFLSGDPECMEEVEPEAEFKRIKVYFNCSYSGSTGAAKIFNRGILVIALMEALQNLGYFVDLEFFEMSSVNDEVFYSSVNLKRNGNSIDVPSAYAMLVHPCYLRRILFRAMEVAPDLRMGWSGGYGNIMKYDTQKKLILPKGENSIFIGTPSDMGITVDLVSSAKNFLQKIGFSDLIDINSKSDIIMPIQSNFKSQILKK